MPAFPRTVLPAFVAPAAFPGPLVSRGETGKLQVRAFTNMGRTWSETWPNLDSTDAAVRAFLATVQWLWRSGTIFTIDHRMHLTPSGVATGTPLVAGASQTGEYLVTDGWTPSITGILKAGDILSLAGLNAVRDVVEDASSNGSGQATLRLNPPIWAGASPADNAALTVTGVTFRAFFDRAPELPEAGPDRYLAGFSLGFAEVP